MCDCTFVCLLPFVSLYVCVFASFCVFVLCVVASFCFFVRLCGCLIFCLYVFVFVCVSTYVLT